jgi:hypothetical protein
MVGLLQAFIRIFHKEDTRDQDIADLTRLLKKFVDYPEKYMDAKIEIDELRRQLAADRLPFHMYQ